jgi:hypothetical protein
MELLHKSGQLSNVVIFKAPCQIGGENSNATGPEKKAAAISSRRRIVIQCQLWIEAKRAKRLILEKKQAGSHFIETKNRDSMPTVDRGKASHATDPGKKSGQPFHRDEES